MDRYWISNKNLGRNKVDVPSEDELKKFAVSEEPKPKDRSLEAKANLCAEIVKLLYPSASDRQVVQYASNLMQHKMDRLLKQRERILYKRAQ